MFDMPDGSWETRGGWVVRRLAADLRLTLTQAAGVVGNLGFESGEFKIYHEVGQPEGRGGYGWGQWTAARREKFFAWAASQLLEPQLPEASYGFLVHELSNDYKSFTAKLRRTTDVAMSTRLVHIEYETPSDVLDKSMRSYPQRLRYAERALAGAKAQPAKLEKLPLRAEQAVAAFKKATLRLQTQMKAAGFDPGPLDGLYGKRTEAALAAYLARYYP